MLDALKNGVDLICSKMGGKGKTGINGLLHGWGFALMGACNLGLDFCVDYYGMMESVDEVKGVNGPVLLILASEDGRITPWAFQSFLPAASAHKKRVEVQLYPMLGMPFIDLNGRGIMRTAPRTLGLIQLLFCRASNES